MCRNNLWFENLLKPKFWNLNLCLQMNDGETSPPPLLTEADLIALMDKHEIGEYKYIYKYIYYNSPRRILFTSLEVGEITVNTRCLSNIDSFIPGLSELWQKASIYAKSICSELNIAVTLAVWCMSVFLAVQLVFSVRLSGLLLCYAWRGFEISLHKWSLWE